MFRRRKKQQALAFGGVTAEDDRIIEVQRPDSEARSHFWAESRLLLRDLVFIVMGAVLLVVFVVQPVKVEGSSMLPRLHDGERIFVNKLINYKSRTLRRYGWPKLDRGDIVVFWYPDDPDKSYIKRIVGLPGEIVEVREGLIFINGMPLEEPYLDPQLNLGHASHQPVMVKEHYYFVMGDNRDNSSDSRIWGLVPEKYIYGKALMRYWPPSSVSIISHDAKSAPAPDATYPPGAIEEMENEEDDEP